MSSTPSNPIPPHDLAIDGIETQVQTAEASATALRTPLLKEGQQFGDYRIVRLIGRGGMGEVYEADEVTSGRRVAVKVVNLATSSPVALQRFLREGQVAASLSHPNTVYVFGAGEIDGIPYIVTELVTGGTLADRVKSAGPLSASRAVDAILDVIAGLAAAAELGVLHRDVKPSNCFVLADGSVKVGDFGVSTPLDARELTELTLTGVIIGTPSFCSPEQLKGQRLDVRSDIYSVGATLFYLLEGRPPFSGNNIVELIEQVLAASADVDSLERKGVPPRLSQVVTACLEKSPERRPATYEELVSTLKPFSSVSPTPAARPTRTLAALLDFLVLVAIWNFTNSVISAPATWSRLAEIILLTASQAAATIAYFTGFEYARDASLGKLLCGIRVGSSDGSRITFWSALTRACIVAAFYEFAFMNFSGLTGLALRPVGLVALPLLVVTARRANNYAGLHELLSGSRTWDNPARRSSRAPVTVPQQVSEALSQSIGPFQLLRQYPGVPGLFIARDDRLKRQVWVRIAPAGAPATSPARRDLDRPARFRWHGGKRTSDESWDAFEHADGRPFVSLDAGPDDFHTIAGWLHALARECRASSVDATLPAISLDRLWLTRTGDMKVADWPLPDAESEGTAYVTTDVSSCQAFLVRVAAHALNRTPGRRPLPLFGTSLLTNLAQQRFIDFDDLVAACETVATRDTGLSTMRRAAPIAAAAIVAAIPLISVLPRAATYRLNALRTQLIVCLRELESLDKGNVEDASGARREAAEMCVAAASRGLTPMTVENVRQLNPTAAALLAPAISKYPRVSIEDLETRERAMPADFSLWRFRPAQVAAFEAQMIAGMAMGNMVQTIELLGLVGLVCVVIALILKEGPFYRVLGIAIVRADGSSVSRPYALARALITWLPAFVGMSMVIGMELLELQRILNAFTLVVVMGAAAVFAALRPQRGLAERLTGTYLVRR